MTEQTATDDIPEQFQNVNTTKEGLDYYSTAYYLYFKLLDRGIVTFKNRIGKEQLKSLIGEDEVEVSDEDIRDICSTIVGSEDSEPLFAVQKERKSDQYKLDLLRAEKRPLPGEDEKQWCVWIQYGDDIRGFTDDGDYRDGFQVTHRDHVEWAENNDYGAYMKRVVSEDTLEYIFEGSLDSLKDRSWLLDYVKSERKKLLNK